MSAVAIRAQAFGAFVVAWAFVIAWVFALALALVVPCATVTAQTVPVTNDDEDPGMGEAPRIRIEDDGRLRVHSSRTSLAQLLRRVTESVGLDVASSDALMSRLESRTPTVDLEDVTFEELLEFLGGAYGIETTVRDGLLSVERGADPSQPASWSERKAKAIAYLRRALLRYPGYGGAWRAYLAIGDLQFRDGMFDLAISEYRMILTIDAPPEGLAEAKYALGRTYLAAGEPVQARFYLGDFARSHPEDPRYVEVYEMIARSFLIEGDGVMASRAIAVLLENELTREQRGRALVVQGEAYAEVGRHEDAVRVLDEALLHPIPGDVRVAVRLDLTEQLLAAGRSASALTVVRDLLGSGDPATARDRGFAFEKAGRAYRDLGRASDELLAFERAYERLPDEPSVVRGFARALEENGLDERAAAVWSDWNAPADARTDVAWRLATIRERLGLLEKAREAYETAAADPERAFDAGLAVARILELQGAHRAAYERLDSMPDDGPLRSERLRAKARCLVALEREDEAVDLLTFGAVRPSDGRRSSAAKPGDASATGGAAPGPAAGAGGQR